MLKYRDRLVDPLLHELLGELPALMLVGPRATGKTTTAARLSTSVVRLDQPGEAAAFEADPDAALRGLAEPVLLDEWQAVPEVLGAVKRSVDRNPRPGRFVLTGSVRADIDAETWPGTGRVVRVQMFPLTVAERLGIPSRPLVDRVVAGEELGPADESPDLLGYVELALQGGFPEAAFAVSPRARSRWLGGYIDQLITRDALTVDTGRDPARLGRFFEAYALNSAGLAEDKTIYDAVGINRKTALAYERLLRNLMVVQDIPAWTSNRLKRLILSSKRYVIDPSLMARVIGVDSTGILRNGDLLGRIFDTFVTAELRAQASVIEPSCRLYHLRQQQGRREIDLVIELGSERLIGIEIKASSAPTAKDARHLAWLREQIGDRFMAGLVLHTGPAAYGLGERIVAAPISTLWA